MLYDPQTRSELQTVQPYPSKNNKRDKLIVNADGSVDLYFGPKAPAGKEANWIADRPRQGLVRALPPLRPARAVVRQDVAAGRDRRGEVVAQQDLQFASHSPEEAMPSRLIAVALASALTIPSAAQAQKMKTEIPASITTPDSVETRLGTLRFVDGFPDDATTQKVYDNIDFQRGVDAFLDAMPGASVEALRVGFRDAGVTDNQTVLIMETLMDSRSLFLTGNTETVYSLTWLDLKDGPLVVETPPNVLGMIDDHWFKYVRRPRQCRARQREGRQVSAAAARLRGRRARRVFRASIADASATFRSGAVLS